MQTHSTHTSLLSHKLAAPFYPAPISPQSLLRPTPSRRVARDLFLGGLLPKKTLFGGKPSVFHVHKVKTHSAKMQFDSS